MIDAMPPIVERRRGRRLAVWNGAIWAVGNGLAGTTLIVYLARELHAERFGLGIGLIAAAPHVVGLLRLGAPAMIGRLANRKRFCLTTFLLSALLLAALPAVCAPGRLPTPGWSLFALVILWCLYHLLQYLGMVGLWSWLADAAPPRIRGRFFGWRQRWIVAGVAAAAIDAGLFVWGMSETRADLPAWMPYAVMAGLGAAFMIVALVPLAMMPECRTVGGDSRRRLATQGGQSHFRGGQAKSRGEIHCAAKIGTVPSERLPPPTITWTAPFRDARFRRLLLFGCWFSFFNGITQSAQHQYSMNVLGISLLVSLVLQTGMNLGQWTVSPWLGRMADRLGNRAVMITCQLLVAVGLLFFAAATPEHWQWLIGAWAMWIAYAGMNVCLPNLMLKLSPPGQNTSYIAAFYAATGLCYAANTILGGALVDCCKDWSLPMDGGVWLSFFPCLFVFGWLMRSLGAFVLLLVVEPGRSRLPGGT